MNTLSKFFKQQEQYSVQDAFDQSNDFKLFFVNHDALHNLENDLVYTIKQRYNCKLRCKICFLHDEWFTDDEMLKYTPSIITDEHKAKTFDIFNYFDKIVSMDDLRDLKRNHPHLFGFYKDIAPMMEFHTTDNGFFSQYTILRDDIQFKEIGQISLSDFLLDRNDGTLIDDIISKLCVLNDVSPISRINFVITKPNPENNPNIMKIVNWASNIDNSLAIYFHNDIRSNVDFFEHLRDNLGYKQPSCYYIEHSTKPVTKCNVYSETIHLRYDSFFPDLYASMDENHQPFFNLENYSDERLLVAILNEKIKVYKRNVKIMSDHNKLFDYFDYVSNNLVVHDDFTFIPIAMLSPKSAFYHRLIKNGYINTHAGLLKPGKIVKPIITWRK